MRREAPLLLVASLAALLLGGCGLVRVEGRAIPSVPGAVAATAWEPQEPTLPAEVASLPGVTEPDAYLDRMIEALMGVTPEAPDERHGILSRDGGTAVGYLQLVAPELGQGAVAHEARLTLTRQADGTWLLTGIETRSQCGAPLVAGACGDTLERGDEPAPPTRAP